MVMMMKVVLAAMRVLYFHALHYAPPAVTLFPNALTQGRTAPEAEAAQGEQSNKEEEHNKAPAPTLSGHHPGHAPAESPEGLERQSQYLCIDLDNKITRHVHKLSNCNCVCSRARM